MDNSLEKLLERSKTLTNEDFKIELGFAEAKGFKRLVLRTSERWVRTRDGRCTPFLLWYIDFLRYFFGNEREHLKVIGGSPFPRQFLKPREGLDPLTFNNNWLPNYSFNFIYDINLTKDCSNTIFKYDTVDTFHQTYIYKELILKFKNNFSSPHSLRKICAVNIISENINIPLQYINVIIYNFKDIFLTSPRGLRYMKLSFIHILVQQYLFRLVGNVRNPQLSEMKFYPWCECFTGIKNNSHFEHVPYEECRRDLLDNSGICFTCNSFGNYNVKEMIQKILEQKQYNCIC